MVQKIGLFLFLYLIRCILYAAHTTMYILIYKCHDCRKSEALRAGGKSGDICLGLEFKYQQSLSELLTHPSSKRS